MKKESKLLAYYRSHKPTIILTSILILGFFLRVYKLSAPSLWQDELMTYARLQGSFLDTIQTLLISPFPPLYYILMKGWTALFGFSEFALRFPSVIFSTLGILYFFLLTKKITQNETTALISSFLLALFPFAINYAQDAKMYPLIWMLMLTSWYYFLCFMEHPTKKNMVLYTFTTLAMIYTLYLGFLFLLTQLLCFVFYPGKKPLHQFKRSILILFIAYLPWAYWALSNMISKSGIEWVSETTNYGTELVFIVQEIMSSYTPLTQLFFLVCTIFGLYTLRKRNAKQSSFPQTTLLAYLCIPLLCFLLIDLLYTPILVPRYLGFFHLPVLILVARGIQYTTRWSRFLPYLLLALYLALTLTNLSPYYEHSLKINGEDWRGFFQEVCAELTNDTFVINAIKSPASTVSYYGTCLPTQLIPASKLKTVNSSTLASAPRILFFFRLHPSAPAHLQHLKNITSTTHYLNKTIYVDDMKAIIFEKR